MGNNTICLNYIKLSNSACLYCTTLSVNRCIWKRRHDQALRLANPIYCPIMEHSTTVVFKYNAPHSWTRKRSQIIPLEKSYLHNPKQGRSPAYCTSFQLGTCLLPLVCQPCTYESPNIIHNATIHTTPSSMWKSNETTIICCFLGYTWITLLCICGTKKANSIQPHIAANNWFENSFRYKPDSRVSTKETWYQKKKLLKRTLDFEFIQMKTEKECRTSNFQSAEILTPLGRKIEFLSLTR